MRDSNSYFYEEIGRQIEFSFIAVEDLNKELLKSNNINMKKFWYSTQSLLISVANVSKILYPSTKSKETNKERAKLLRSELKLEEHSVLDDRDIRNCFEHFDERLDKFIRDCEKNHGIFVDSNISDEKGIVMEGMGRDFYLRKYNPRTNTLTFKDISYELQPVIDALIKLNQKIEKLTQA
jgi:hypothetical protein